MSPALSSAIDICVAQLARVLQCDAAKTAFHQAVLTALHRMPDGVASDCEGREFIDSTRCQWLVGEITHRLLTYFEDELANSSFDAEVKTAIRDNCAACLIAS